MKIKDKNGFLVVSKGKEARTALLYYHKAINYLECFANIVLFLENRMISEKVLPDSEIGVTDKFGFSVNMQEKYWHFVRSDEGENLFLINYFSIENDRRPKGKPIIKGKKRGEVSELLLWTTQINRILIDCAVGCFTDCMVGDRNFAGALWWNNKVKSIANRYAYELDCYRQMLCLRPGENRIKSLKESYGLRIYKEVDRRFLEGM